MVFFTWLDHARKSVLKFSCWNLKKKTMIFSTPLWKMTDFTPCFTRVAQPPSHCRNHSSFDFKSREALWRWTSTICWSTKCHDDQGTFVKDPTSDNTMVMLFICHWYLLFTWRRYRGYWDANSKLAIYLLMIDESWSVKMSWLRHDDMRP